MQKARDFQSFCEYPLIASALHVCNNLPIHSIMLIYLITAIPCESLYATLLCCYTGLIGIRRLFFLFFLSFLFSIICFHIYILVVFSLDIVLVFLGKKFFEPALYYLSADTILFT